MIGETIQLSTETTSGLDPYGGPIKTVTWSDVADVLVAPSKTLDVDVGERPFGDETRIELHFPTGFAESLRNRHVRVRGIEYAIEGDPIHYIADNTPTRWWLEAQAVRVDG